ncbi:hypothetical protein Dtox_0637 [Desulfofarcimen acetoxidans DSM 771]|jgi:hypothetical protein|uniref:Uncharacterized protein n=1 Tax=Desulfofarcimen acetoxidans (strain ATCC 49208 / DSM 771 / KCTC 5769 / VKM B-1644 / 5575) TaxID=485916 RepID=C8W1B1_DESAS|nr:hypothetical protein Dtox_0637 [Desulfofarcimen acetoxidans DSM 771]
MRQIPEYPKRVPHGHAGGKENAAVYSIELKANYEMSIELNPRFEDLMEGLIDLPAGFSHKEYSVHP